MNKKLKTNLAYNIIYQVVIVFLPLVLSPYLARTLGAEKSGVYAYHYSIAHYFVLFSMLGISTYGNRIIATVRDDKEKLSKIFCSLFFFHLLVGVLVFIIYLVYVMCLVNADKDIAFILSFFVFSSIFDITWFFFGIEEFKTTVIRNVIVKIVNFVSIFIFVKASDDLWIYTMIMSICFCLSQFAVWPFVSKYIRFVKVTWKDVQEHIKPNLILFLPVIATSIFAYMDKIMLGTMNNKLEVGYYDYAEKIIDVPKSVIRAMGTVMLPTTTNMLINGDVDKNKKFLEKTLFFVIFISIPILFGLASISSIFAPIYFGDDYFISGKIITLLCPALFFSVIGNVVRTQYLLPASKDKEYIISLFAGAIINICVNLALIPNYGAQGAAIGTVAAEFTLCFFQFWYTKRYINFKRVFKNSIVFFPCGIVMYLIVGIIKQNVYISIYSLILEIFIGIVVYVFLLILVFVSPKNEDILELKNNLLSKFHK